MKKIIKIGAYCVGLVLLLYLLPRGCIYLASQNTEFYILDQVRDATAETYLVLLYRPGEFTNLGTYSLIVSNEKLSVGDKFPALNQRIFSMKEGGSGPIVSYQNNCYLIKAEHANSPSKFSSGWLRYWIAGATNLNDGDRWLQEINGKPVCFVFQE